MSGVFQCRACGAEVTGDSAECSACGRALEPAPTTKACPFCAETIQAAAVVCRFCQRDLSTGAHPATPTQSPNAGLAAVLSFFIPGLGSIYQGSVALGIGFLVGTAFAYVLFFPFGLMFHVVSILVAAATKPPSGAIFHQPTTNLKCSTCGYVQSLGPATCKHCGAKLRGNGSTLTREPVSVVAPPLPPRPAPQPTSAIRLVILTALTIFGTLGALVLWAVASS